MTMRKFSPVAVGVKNKALRVLCLVVMQIAASFARYTEKLLRGYYLPDSIVGRERPIH